MIKGFKHKGLERFFTTGKKPGIQAKHARRLRLILGRLSVAIYPEDMDLPGLRLHKLKGNKRGVWAVDVEKNWRVTFIFKNEDVSDVNYEDYH